MGSRKRHGQENGESTKNDAKNGVHVNGKKSDKSPTPQPDKGDRNMVRAIAILSVIFVGVSVYAALYTELPQVLDQYRQQWFGGAEKVDQVWSTRTQAHQQTPSQDASDSAKRASPRDQAEEKITKPKEKGYVKAKITNSLDNKIRGDLDEADALIDQGQFEEAQRKFERLIARYMKSPRAQYGKSLAIDKLSEVRQSNVLLEQCIEEYQRVIDLPDVPKELALIAGKRAADRMQFRGWAVKGARVLRKLLTHYPEEYTLWNDLGVKYLMSGKNEEARKAFNQVLEKEPNNGFALVHAGFIIKTNDNNAADAIPLLQRGIETEAPGTIDGRFFFHLGDAYTRVGNTEKALEIYQKGADAGLFASKWQRSLYNVDGLKAQPWWTAGETGQAHHLKKLEDNWEKIKKEALANMDEKTGSFLPEDENLRETGDWKQFTLFQQGRKNEAACRKAPFTCSLIEKFQEAAGCKRGQVKFSIMHPGVHVWPHCGPTNCRIRAHLGLIVPDGVRIRVTDDTRTWKEGKFIIFDDSFEHEVWHEGDSFRIVLIVDIWHPELTTHQKMTLAPI